MDEHDKFRIWSNDEQGEHQELGNKPLLLFASLFIWIGMLSLYVVIQDLPRCDIEHTHAGPQDEIIYLEEYD